MTQINQTIYFTLTPVLFLAFLSLFVSVAEASSVVRSGETVSLSDEQVIEGDFYSAAGKINVSGSVQEDMVLAGGQVTLNGSVGGDSNIIGGQVDIHGTVGDDLRIISGEVTIAEPVMGDVFVMGGVVNILSTASVAGDVVLFVGEATIEGSVGGNVFGTIDRLRIDAQVAGDVDVKVGEFTLGDKAVIEGSVSYVSSILVNRAQNATVSGEMVRNDPILPMNQSNVRSVLIPMLVLLFSTLAWYWISRRSLQKVVERALIKSPRPFIIGTITLIFAPFAIVMLMGSMIGAFVGFAGMFAYLLLVTLSLIGLSVVLGQLLMRAFNQPSAYITTITLGVGVIGVSALLMLPMVGALVILGFMILTLGSMVDLLIRPSLD